MKSAVLVFPGINRERDMARARRLVSGQAPAMVWHAETALPAGTDLVVIPGGFSYGDYLRCGAIGARQLDVEHLALAHAGDAIDAERFQRAFNGLALWIENAGLQRNGDARFHEKALTP